MIVRVQTVVEAPRDDVYDILSDFGSEVRLRVSPSLSAQRIVERHDNAVVCENEWFQDNRHYVRQRRYTLYPKHRIVDEPVEPESKMARVTIDLDPDGENTLLTMTTEYRFRAISWLLARLMVGTLRQMDERYVATFKEKIENEFEEVEEEDDEGEKEAEG